MSHRHPLTGLWSLAILALLTVAVGPTVPAAAQAADGARLFRDLCADCHGRGGERRALGQSRRLIDLDTATLRRTLEERRALTRPKTMQDRVKGSLTAADAEAVIAHVATLGGAGSE
jgi:cytochrome c553